MKYTKEEYKLVDEYIQSVIVRCEKMQPKFHEGTAQSTLLKNRIYALKVVESILLNKDANYTIEELERALPPIASILRKCKKAQAKYETDSIPFNRFKKQINSMEIAKNILENEVTKTNKI